MAEDNWKHRSEEMRCKNCMFYVPKGVTILGRCRESSPKLEGWPPIYESDWCGDHKIDETKLLKLEGVEAIRPAFTDFLTYSRQLVQDGLTTDGGHHKQYYLEKLYFEFNQMLGIVPGTEKVFEKGIAP